MSLMRGRLMVGTLVSVSVLGLGAMAGAPLLAQQGPESLLPPGFDRPARQARPSPTPPRPAASSTPRPVASTRPVAATPSPAPTRAAPAPRIDLPENEPTITAQPLFAAPTAPVAAGPVKLPTGVTSYAQLMALPPDKLDQLLGLRPRYDIPPGSARALRQVGVIDQSEGGLGSTLASQNYDLLRAALTGNGGQMVSRWGHILLRRALVSRLDPPGGGDPADFVAMRVALLLRMGEGDLARAVAQDVDPDNYNPALTAAALDSYVATEDFTGFCPIMGVQPAFAKDPRWSAMQGMCDAFSGNAAGGFANLDHMIFVGAMPRIDMQLALKYAGAAGTAGRSGRRNVTIEWDKVAEMTPWRYALTLAVGLTPPAKLMQDLPAQYDYVTATAPMVGLGPRADASDRAGSAGILSSSAMVDLYSQIYANDDVTGSPSERALLLRDAYVAGTPADRLKAMKSLWDGAADPGRRYARQVLTAYAAARLPVSGDYAGDAGDLIASMLAAGLDGNAMRWSGVVPKGSLGWALLALADGRGGEADTGALSSFAGADKSDSSRKTAFLVAGLSGLGRVSDSTRRDYAGKLSVDFDGHSRWSEAIDQAAALNNQTLVVMLAGLGMQGDSWGRMTPRYLYHIVSALNRVGLGAEARMIAAEAVARA